ncbi:fibronectin type III domain-containing protein [Paenibacillus sp. GSMTC-2017]|uniref:fibronectin type III domain-containing protein n=1 Tax=Paenibacillus sp. GSMTC-2017 TaxID=2794350 RepID=UPI0018D8917E|nr:fibronectin type III domain-containing protein [Paenibacillus sp. GSMTC-2017]MBH5317695.1 fibronectin type III domain-containing protein [Paenibacillus sp. GSMTC-2017]
MKRLLNARKSLKRKAIIMLTVGALIGSVVPSLVSATGADTQAPTAPTGLQFITGNSTSISFHWNAATDNVGVVAYQVYRSNFGILVGTVPSTTLTFTDTGLTPGTPYSYSVRAVDAAGNISPYSHPIGIKLPTE